jgi:arylsulfatase A-like enzyme
VQASVGGWCDLSHPALAVVQIVPSRRWFRACLVLAPLFTGCFLGQSAWKHADAAEARSERPNLIVLVADDLRWDALGCAGNATVHTPHLDRLAAEGLHFANSFVTDSICAPSRASILTGQYVRRHGIDDFAKTFTAEQWAETYPALLRRSGYRTGFIGKYGVGSVMPEAEFDCWRGFAGQGDYFQPDSEMHLTTVMGDQAIEFLHGGQANQPFCLSISFKAPHSQVEAAGGEYPPDPHDARLYADLVIPPPPTFGERFFEALPAWARESEGRRRWLLREYDRPDRYQESLRNYYRLVTGIDREVGRIREALRELGLDGDTLIVFTSDNGYFLGGRGLVDKFFMYEESIRVPLIVFDPRLPAENGGRQVESMVLNIDLAPTLLDYASVAAPVGMQGRSWRPLVEGRDAAWRIDWFYEHHYSHGGTIPPSEGVRTERWKYIRWTAADPLEEHNLTDDPAHQETLLELRGRWQELREELR